MLGAQQAARLKVYVVKLIAFNGSRNAVPDFVAAATVAKSSVPLVRKAETGHTVAGNVSVSVEAVVLGFIAMTLYAVDVETAIIHCCTSLPMRGCRTLPAAAMRRLVVLNDSRS